MFTKTFGVELEFIAPSHVSRRAVAEALNAVGVESYDAGYSHAVSNKWKLVSDASVSGTGIGMELVSPILRGEPGLAKLKLACDVLVRLDCTVNRTCGLHVHVGAREMSIRAMRRLAILYSDFEGVLDSVMPASRRANNNTYLQSLRDMNKGMIDRATQPREIALQINNGSRYAKLNFTAHWKHGTVEFRHHAGTVAYDKARNWVLTCLRLVATAEREENVAVAIATGTDTRRPRTGALRTIYDLCARPEGCTREEARVALGRTSPPQMTRLTEDAGIALRRVGQRYFLAEQPAVNTVAAAEGPINLETFCAKLAMTDDEKAFWKARQEFFAADTISQRIGFAPGSRAAQRAGL
jgi:putative amidoligase enzyme